MNERVDCKTFKWSKSFAKNMNYQINFFRGRHKFGELNQINQFDSVVFVLQFIFSSNKPIAKPKLKKKILNLKNMIVL